MSVKYTAPNEFTLALLKAANVPDEIAQRATSVVYRHRVGSVPTIHVEMHVIDSDAGVFDTVSHMFHAVEQ